MCVVVIKVNSVVPLLMNVEGDYSTIQVQSKCTAFSECTYVNNKDVFAV